MRQHTWVFTAMAVATLWPTVVAAEWTVHRFDPSDWTEQALAIAAANAGPQKGQRPLQPALRDVLVAGLPNGRIAIVTPATNDGPRVLPVLSHGAQDITADDYAIVGRVRYGGTDDETDMDGVGYLEMWSEFADGSRYFTRTLADDGPLQRLSGHSGGRPFRLPFHDPNRRPVRLALNIVLPGRASIELSDVRLVQDAPAATAAATVADPPPPWWARDHSTGLAIGLFGCIGFLGFAEPLIRRGRGRGFVLSTVVGVGLLGQGYFGWALAMVGRGEPVRAWGPLLVCAAAAWCVPASIPILNRRYREAELRRMRALDAVAV